MSDCPLKQAARDAPNALAYLSKEVSLTFAQLDRYADEIDIAHPLLTISSLADHHFIAQLFAAWRRGASVYSINPKIPTIQSLAHTPPRSLLLRTSGSTHTPKIACLSIENLIASAATAIVPLDLRPNDQWLLSLPLYHVGGIGIVFRCVLARATVVVGDSPHITHLSYVPTQLYRSTPLYKHLRCLLLGGAPLSYCPAYLPIYTTYGLTEMSSLVTLNDQLLPKRELAIAPDGEILVRGPTLFQGYIQQAQSQTQADGQYPSLFSQKPTDWFATGDLGSFENERLVVTGRKDWMFISGGENIQPEEIERALLTLPSVLEAAVVPKDDPEFGKRPVAILKTTQTVTADEIQKGLLDYLPKYKIPKEVIFIEEMPQNNNLKRNRFILMQMVNNQLTKNISGQKK